MQDGFVTCAVCSPTIRVADCPFNVQSIATVMAKAEERHVSLLVLPELVVTGYTCGDLFLQRALQEAALCAVEDVVELTRKSEMLVVFGAPLVVLGRLYNCAVVAQKGTILGIVPKRNIPNYQEFYEKRWFAIPDESIRTVEIAGRQCPFGTDLLFSCSSMKDFVLGVELCEDLWVPESPSVALALGGATIVANCSASDELVGKKQYRRTLVSAQSAKLVCGYLYSGAGYGESSTDLVFCGHNLAYEYGTLLGEQFQEEDSLLVTQIDVAKMVGERIRMNSFNQRMEQHTYIPFSLTLHESELSRFIDPAPFVPTEPSTMSIRCEKILSLQALGLKKRLDHIGCRSVVIGLSGGLDSTLALLVAVRSFDMLGFDRNGIVGVTMPCFGTTKRTKGNATRLAHALGITLLTIPIDQAVHRHFSDIGHDESSHDVTYENSQARERTQVLMDLANARNALVVGTGDLSELALGWATYNGDHMSMYGVNVSVPKTLVRHLVSHVAEKSPEAVRTILLDVVATPVSPELLPASEDGTISQVTEDIVGPYALHDFFLYQVLRWGFSPRKVLRLAQVAFAGTYDRPYIARWLSVFYRRFFAQQFKRSCLPDGPKVGSVTLSPRGDWRMPSDASLTVWKAELDAII